MAMPKKIDALQNPRVFSAHDFQKAPGFFGGLRLSLRVAGYPSGL